MSVQPAFAGEVQFAGYSDSSRSGPRVTLRLADRDDLARFIGLEGRRFMAALVPIADDETADAPDRARSAPESVQNGLPGAPAAGESAAKAPPRAKGGALAQLAGRLCAAPEFWDWVGETYQVRIDSEAGCARWLREALGVESRAEIDADEDVAADFHRDIRRPYVEWQRARGVAL